MVLSFRWVFWENRPVIFFRDHNWTENIFFWKGIFRTQFPNIKQSIDWIRLANFGEVGKVRFWSSFQRLLIILINIIFKNVHKNSKESPHYIRFTILNYCLMLYKKIWVFIAVSNVFIGFLNCQCDFENQKKLHVCDHFKQIWGRTR